MWRPAEDRLFERYQQRRDARLLGKVFDRTAEPLWRIARHLAGSAHAADDLVQQTFLVAIERAASWDKERGVFPWLVGILTNQARLARRAARREPDPARLTAGAPSEPPSAPAEARELHDAITAAVAELGDAYRPVLHLHLFHGLNAQQIGEALGRPAGSVRTQLVRGLERLRRALPVGLGVAAAAATASAQALATIRRLVLSHAGPTTAAAGGAMTLLTLGGMTMKKVLTLAVAALLLIGGFVLAPNMWQSTPEVPTRTPGAPASGALVEAPAAPLTAPNASAAELRTAAATSAPPPPSTASVRVHCTARDGAADVPAAGAWIELRPQDDTEPQQHRPERRRRTADAAGIASFDAVPAGNWRAIAFLGMTQTTADLTVAPDGEHPVELAIQGTSGVDVLVVDSRGAPVADAELWLGMDFLGRIAPVQVTSQPAGRTGADGRARVLSPGLGKITARKAGYAASLAGPTAMLRDELLTLVLRDAPGQLDGEVLDDRGEPVAGAVIVVTPDDDDPSSSQQRTADGRTTRHAVPWLCTSDRYGRFRVLGLPAGAYRIFPEFAQQPPDELQVHIEAHVTSSVQLRLARTAQVLCSVQHPDGSHAVGVRLLASRPDGQRIDSWTLREPATSQRMMLPLGEVVLEVRRNDAVLARRTLQVSEQNPPLDITIDERLMVAGRLLDTQGAPVADWFVVAFADAELTKERWFEAAMRLGFPRTGVDGTFSLWGPADGPLTVVARREGTSWRDEAPQITARRVAVGTADLTLRLPAEALQQATLAGSVVDTSGALLADAELMVQLSSDRNFQPIVSDGGRFRIEGFDLGQHRILVNAPGHAPRHVEVTLSEAETTLPPIELQRSVPLRVRPLLPPTPPWRGPLPRPVVRNTEGVIVSPHPQISVDDDTLQLHGLPAGRYVLHAPENDDITAEPLSIELLLGVPLEVDWPVHVGAGRDK